ncbi:hypothetical protein QF022_001548 [Vogesella perlucida]|nr:hypothetical protein [Vogesella perlucida]
MRYISGLGSPTDSPPTAMPSKPMSIRPSSDSWRRSRYRLPCTMPNSALGFFRSSKARRERSAQRRLMRIDLAAVAWSTWPGVHSSKIITMSEFSTFWISIDFSGDRNSLSPLTGLWKVTPSSEILFMAPRLNTWKPPESVRMGLSQPMKSCRPPNCSMISRPGRSHRWKVLPRMIWALMSCSSCGLIAFTEP